MTAYVPGLDERELRKYALSLQQLASGRSNAVGTVTCSTLGTTTVTNANCSAGSQPQLTASSSNGAAAYTSTWVSTVSNGSFVVSHTVASTTDRTFRYAIVG
jgi:type II secretory pathway component HofQ